MVRIPDKVKALNHHLFETLHVTLRIPKQNEMNEEESIQNLVEDTPAADAFAFGKIAKFVSVSDAPLLIAHIPVVGGPISTSEQ